MKVFVSAATLLLTAAVVGALGVITATADSPDQAQVVTMPGYRVAVFARGTSAYSHPDPIVVAAGHVFVAFQNNSAKDGSSGASTIVDYSRNGHINRTFSVPGHVDGMRLDPATHQLWVTANEDGNPSGAIIDPTTGTVKPFTFPTPPHGGGYDDLAFHVGKAFIAASNPNLNSAGVNVFPAVDTIVVNDGKATLTPVLAGNATALDTTTNQTVMLNLTDPDSMTIDPSGAVVLVDQADSEIVFIHNAATPQQSVTRVPTGTQLDDTVWATKDRGTLFVVDSPANTIYTLTSDFKPGTVYTEAPNDSGVAGFVGTVDLKTGIVTPIAIGFSSPTGLLFVPDANDDDDPS